MASFMPAGGELPEQFVPFKQIGEQALKLQNLFFK
jgi:hypothetical protein